jgi:hypothetical protein
VLFGGYGFATSTSGELFSFFFRFFFELTLWNEIWIQGYLSDMWEYDSATGIWTWIHGSDEANVLRTMWFCSFPLFCLTWFFPFFDFDSGLWNSRSGDNEHYSWFQIYSCYMDWFEWKLLVVWRIQQWFVLFLSFILSLRFLNKWNRKQQWPVEVRPQYEHLDLDAWFKHSMATW